MQYLVTRQVGLMVAALALLADALSKGWIVTHQSQLPVTVIRHFFSLVLAWNPGMSFSLLQHGLGPYFLAAMAVAASVGFVHWMGEPRAPGAPWLQIGLGLLTGGALGNLLDRVQHGAVVDFLLFYGKHWYFPVFNLADSAITLGVVVLLWDSLRRSLPGRS